MRGFLVVAIRRCTHVMYYRNNDIVLCFIQMVMVGLTMYTVRCVALNYSLENQIRVKPVTYECRYFVHHFSNMMNKVSI